MSDREGLRGLARALGEVRRDAGCLVWVLELLLLLAVCGACLYLWLS